jgi:hypothetical protein
MEKLNARIKSFEPETVLRQPMTKPAILLGTILAACCCIMLRADDTNAPAGTNAPPDAGTNAPPDTSTNAPAGTNAPNAHILPKPASGLFADALAPKRTFVVTAPVELGAEDQKDPADAKRSFARRLT